MITFEYNDEEKEIPSIPQNFRDLKQYFLDIFDEKNSNIFEFSYIDENIDNEKKIIIQEDQASFEKAINTIKELRFPVIYVRLAKLSEISDGSEINLKDEEIQKLKSDRDELNQCLSKLKKI